jgi:hypothetical protein
MVVWTIRATECVDISRVCVNGSLYNQSYGMGRYIASSALQRFTLGDVMNMQTLAVVHSLTSNYIGYGHTYTAEIL